MIIAVDFDGVLHTGKYPNIGLPAPYATEVMRKFREDGHYIIIWTSRDGQHLIDAVNWLLQHDIEFDRINDNCPLNTEKYGSNSRKVYAHRYIDDGQIGGLPTWSEIYEDVKAADNDYIRKKQVNRGR